MNNRTGTEILILHSLDQAAESKVKWLLGQQLLSASRMEPKGTDQVTMTPVRLETLGDNQTFLQVPSADFNDRALRKLEESLVKEWSIFLWAISRVYPELKSLFRLEKDWRAVSFVQTRQAFVDFLAISPDTRRSLNPPAPLLIKTSSKESQESSSQESSPLSSAGSPLSDFELAVRRVSLGSPLPSPLFHTFPKIPSL